MLMHLFHINELIFSPLHSCWWMEEGPSQKTMCRSPCAADPVQLTLCGWPCAADPALLNLCRWLCAADPWQTMPRNALTLFQGLHGPSCLAGCFNMLWPCSDLTPMCSDLIRTRSDLNPMCSDLIPMCCDLAPECSLTLLQNTPNQD